MAGWLAVTAAGTLLTNQAQILRLSGDFQTVIVANTNNDAVAINLVPQANVTAGLYSAVTVSTTGVITRTANLVATGDATGTAAGSNIALTLASVGTAGTYTFVTTDTKGRVISGQYYIVVFSGDVNATISSASVTATLSPVGIAGTYTSVTTDSKGRVIAGSNIAYLPLTGGSLSGPLSGTVFSAANSVMAGPSGGTMLSNNPAQMTGNTNSFVQIGVQNLSNGGSASSDIVATANDGNDTTYFVDLGINGSGYNDNSFTITQAHDSYLYSQGGNMAVGTATGGVRNDLVFFTGGTLAANERLRISATGTLSGTAISLYLATPPAIGGSIANTGAFTTLTATTPSAADNSTKVATTAWVNASNNWVISTTYTVSGAIAPGDNVSVINAANAATMTLAAGTIDGHQIVIKRYGTGTVTVAATIDGSSRVIDMTSTSVKECIILFWSNSLASYILI